MNQKILARTKKRGFHSHSDVKQKGCKSNTFYDFTTKPYKVGQHKKERGPRFGFWY